MPNDLLTVLQREVLKKMGSAHHTKILFSKLIYIIDIHVIADKFY